MKNTNVLVVGIVLAIVFTFTVALAGCGNESGTAINTTSTPTPTPGSVTITCVDHIQIGVQSPATYTCKANEGVTWSVSNSVLATITSASSTTGVLVPNTITTGVVTVTATATTGNDTAATATVKVVDWILYATNSGRFIMNPDGSGVTQILTMSPLCMHFSWSYDHLEFICANTLAANATQFAIYSTDGTAVGTKVVSTLNLAAIGGLNSADYPSLSPDETKIVFTGITSTNVNGIIEYTEGTWVVNVDGTGLTELSTEPQDGINILNPRFSPDGKEILYQRGNNVWIMNTDGTNQHQLVSATSWSAIFSPDMKKLYYTNSGGAFIANADGTNAALIPLSAGDTVYGISPNGASIVLWNMSSETTYTANSDGSNLKQIASPADNPAW